MKEDLLKIQKQIENEIVIPYSKFNRKNTRSPSYGPGCLCSFHYGGINAISFGGKNDFLCGIEIGSEWFSGDCDRSLKIEEVNLKLKEILTPFMEKYPQYKITKKYGTSYNTYGLCFYGSLQHLTVSDIEKL